VPNRRQTLLDAAIEVLGERGMRALTHRAVDAEAGLAAGSTANYFPTREALLEAVVDGVSAMERGRFDEIAAEVCPAAPAELGRTIAGLARDVTGARRTLTCRGMPSWSRPGTTPGSGTSWPRREAGSMPGSRTG
jgi:DNA-binding transcriptional regulator YbjK